MPKIVRVGELKDYTIIENACLRDKALDITERGLLVTILSLPDNWDFSGLGLTSILPCGKSKAFSSLKKLEEAGYLKRKRIYINGKVADWEYYNVSSMKNYGLYAYFKTFFLILIKIMIYLYTTNG